jgi:hypothetical protein
VVAFLCSFLHTHRLQVSSSQLRIVRDQQLDAKRIHSGCSHCCSKNGVDGVDKGLVSESCGVICFLPTNPPSNPEVAALESDWLTPESGSKPDVACKQCWQDPLRPNYPVSPCK